MSETSNQMGSGKIGRNDPCHCGSGKKFKKCCGFNTPTTTPANHVEDQSTPQARLEDNRRQLDALLARYAPTVTVNEVEDAIKKGIEEKVKHPMEVVQKIFNDDNLKLSNKKHAQRLFDAFMKLWNSVLETAN
jgi:hypothetical protein